MKKSNYIKKFFKAVALVAVMVTLLPTVLTGCEMIKEIFGDTIVFTKSQVTMTVDEVYDLKKIIRTYESLVILRSSDANTVTVDGEKCTMRAVAAGSAKINAEAGGVIAVLDVTVTYGEEDTFDLSVTGELVQSSARKSTITFMPVATGAAAKFNIAWYVDGVLKKQTKQGVSYDFMPSGVGEYVIEARCGTFTAQKTVRVMQAVNASVTSSGGSLSQNEAPYTDIVFTVAVDNEESCYIQWFKNGIAIYEGSEKTYTYKPTPGRYTLVAKVNGEQVYNAEVVCHGAVVPAMPTVVYDNLYPHVYVQYEAYGNAQVEITNTSGEITTYSETDSSNSRLFTDNGFDVGELITLCTSGSEQKSYKFRVKSLGDGETYTESEYSQYFTLRQLPSTAKKYIETRVSCGDLYITSDKEYVAVVEYYVFFREKTKPVTVTFDCYIAYDRKCTAGELWTSAFPLAATGGSYSYRDGAKDLGNNVMETSFTVSAINAPSKQAEPSDGFDYATPLHAILPHINFDAGKYRATDYEFPIDRREYEIPVTYSDELYLAAQDGAKPKPVAGSVADDIYKTARDILRKIITVDMTDVQKAHAIYDWIMWQVEYDYPATGVTSDGETCSAYYLEGVFSDGVKSYGGKVYQSYAVCDGMSKAYALMCNIEGIPCVRVVGTAGEKQDTAGGHAWNKVFVNGGWYVVDCTWGDSKSELNLGNGQVPYEMGLHNYLFLTDAQIESNHFEPYRDGNTTIEYAPKTPVKKFGAYADMSINGMSINCVVSSSQDVLERVKEISSAFARAYSKKSTITVPGGANNGVYTIDWQGIEIYVEGEFSKTNISDAVTRAFQSVHNGAEVKVYIFDNRILVLVRT